MYTRQLGGAFKDGAMDILYDGVKVATLTRYSNDCNEHEYVFVVDWDVWDSLQPVQDIPGLNMELRQAEYVRPKLPAFISQSMPPNGREDTPALAKKYGLEYYDIWDFTIACGRNTNDRFRVRKSVDK